MIQGNSLSVRVRDLQPGDYVKPAGAIVASVDSFSCVSIVDFTDSTATAPIPSAAMVEIIRPIAN